MLGEDEAKEYRVTEKQDAFDCMIGTRKVETQEAVSDIISSLAELTRTGSRKGTPGQAAQSGSIRLSWDGGKMEAVVYRGKGDTVWVDVEDRPTVQRVDASWWSSLVEKIAGLKTVEKTKKNEEDVE